MERLNDWFRRKPLESACWCYLILTIVPGVLIFGNTNLLLEGLVRYVLPGAAAVLLTIRYYDGRWEKLGFLGLGKSLLCSAPVAVLCVINVLTAKGNGFPAADAAALVFLGAAGEELMARFLLLLGICAGARDRGWGSTMTVVVAGVIFGLMHAINFLSHGMIGTIAQCCYTAVIGGVFAWSYRKSGCIWGGIFWHFLLNLTAML